MARKFLYFIAGAVVLVLVAAFAYRLFSARIMRAAFVPSAAFQAAPKVAADAYADPAMWYSYPGKGPTDPSLWVPEGYQPAGAPPAALFYIHPTTYLERSAWNAPLDDIEASERARLFLRAQASAFNGVATVWAPKYRQATFGAFLTDRADAEKALALAYGDVLSAFDRFVKDLPADRPIILAGHSQGSLHLTRLLRERVAGRPIAQRIVAVYIVGWPISVDTDLTALGLPPCETAEQAGCLLSWQSFAEPADPSLIFEHYDETTGFNGVSRAGTPMLCTNPLTGIPFTAAGAEANLGTLFPSKDLKSATIEAGRVPARCDGRGILLIGEPPELGPYTLPGNNYHVFDYPLFWANVRADIARRLATYLAEQPGELR
ncbi:DUF3089 domain-containing protein [Sphingomonas flavalba]|uniref:DUF3089 domain-containing protein n=1 Tax=Sphingomonas flavalba TaxID=2559804 RepID=UPI00109DF668|nr:DUF3089 domain-containing protein [Sphingomonas flavalba]